MLLLLLLQPQHFLCKSHLLCAQEKAQQQNLCGATVTSSGPKSAHDLQTSCVHHSARVQL